MRGAPSSVLLPLLLLALLPGAGCRPAPTLPPIPVTPDLAPWQVPSAELGTQRLYRAHYAGPERDGSFRLTLRLDRLDRWQAQANALGRKLWSLEADGERGLWIDHRQGVYCELEGTLELAGSVLAPLPFRAFPALLLGRLPEEAAGPVRHRGGELVVPGEQRRTWRVEISQGGTIERWSLWRRHRPLARWRMEQGEARLSDQAHGVVLRWRPVVREPLAVPLEPLEVPADHRRVECEGLELRPEEGAAGQPGNAATHSGI